jgi:uncharacterized protein (TIGR02646 family)
MRKYFGDKCVYCESIPVASSAFRIDHYRPKDGIKGVNSNDHYGYYWLALEWTNLLQSCEQCNSAKSNSFPLQGSRVNAKNKEPNIVSAACRSILTAPLSGEKRLLLHPELDKVEDHMIFLRDGRMAEKNGSEHGRKTIEVYGLNREGLILYRKKKIDLYFRDIIYTLTKYEQRGADLLAHEVLKNDIHDFFVRLLQEQEPTVEYSRLGFYMIDNFEEFFIERLPIEEHKKFLRDFYNKIILTKTL